MPSTRPEERRLLVTVGTTRFDALIQTILSEPVVDALRRAGYTQWRMQHGSSPLPKLPEKLQIETFPYRQNLKEDIEWANLVIGHAGSGTVLDVLRGRDSDKKQLIIVTNDQLMDGHQSELATQLSSMGVCKATSVKELLKCIEEGDWQQVGGQSNILPKPNHTALNDAIRKLLNEA